MPFFRIHFFDEYKNKRSFDMEATNRDAAMQHAMFWRGLPENAAKELRMVTSLGRVQTGKQKLATQYIFLIGSLRSVEVQLHNVKVIEGYPERIQTQIQNSKSLAFKNIANVKRDIRDMFDKLGIKVR